MACVSLSPSSDAVASGDFRMSQSSVSDTSQVVLPRTNKKPLRFKGYPAHQAKLRGPGGMCEVTLWKRQDRKLAVSIRHPGPEVEHADAMVFSSIDAACEWVETLCAPAPLGSPPGADAPASEVLTFLEASYADRAWRETLGQNLAHILTTWCTTEMRDHEPN